MAGVLVAVCSNFTQPWVHSKVCSSLYIVASSWKTCTGQIPFAVLQQLHCTAIFILSCSHCLHSSRPLNVADENFKAKKLPTKCLSYPVSKSFLWASAVNFHIPKFEQLLNVLFQNPLHPWKESLRNHTKSKNALIFLHALHSHIYLSGLWFTK
jgi:hypothetical protein